MRALIDSRARQGPPLPRAWSAINAVIAASVVLMVAGGSAIIPKIFTDPVRPLTSTIAAEMGETPVGSVHYHALFFAGLILLMITLIINLASFYIEKRGKRA